MKIVLGEKMDNIGYYEDVLSDEFCDKVIEQVKDLDGVNTMGVLVPSEFAQESYNYLHANIVAKLKEYITEFEINSFPDDWGLEPYHVKGFEPDEENPEQYQIDVGSHDMARRFVGIFFVLNDVDESGEIKFYRQDKVIVPKKGSMFIYPSLWTHPQLRILPKSGTEYMMGTYLHYM